MQKGERKAMFLLKSIRDRQGFTLVELLVVIAIIALLLSILVPTLGKAREQAKLVKCRSNLHQQTLACEMYLQDNRNNFPTHVSNPPLPYDCQWNVCYWGGKAGTEPFAPSYIKIKPLLNEYVGKRRGVGHKDEESALQVFHCPSDNGSTGGKWNPRLNRKPSIWDTWGWSYRFNTEANNNNSSLGLFNRNASEVRHPNKVILVHDGSLIAYFAGYNPFEYYYWHNKKQNGWANAAFVDYHIEYIRASPPPKFQDGPNWTFIYNK
jgi:prepilin-type N-terminal cleavage/methylation domain-containing protein